MGLFIFILIIGFIFIGGGWLIGKGLGESLFGERKEKITFNSTHVHHHYHRNISIIDEETKKKIFELKDVTDNKKATD